MVGRLSGLSTLGPETAINMCSISFYVLVMRVRKEERMGYYRIGDSQQQRATKPPPPIASPERVQFIRGRIVFFGNLLRSRGNHAADAIGDLAFQLTIFELITYSIDVLERSGYSEFSATMEAKKPKIAGPRVKDEQVIEAIQILRHVGQHTRIGTPTSVWLNEIHALRATLLGE